MGTAQHGVPAVVNPIPKEYSESFWNKAQYGVSVGLIRIESSLTPFVRVRRARNIYFVDYVVPDNRLSERLGGLSIKVDFKRKFPVIGPKESAFWKGDDRSTGLIRRLDRDKETKKAAMNFVAMRLAYKVETRPESKLWIIRSSAVSPITRSNFDANQRIADALLDTAVF